MGLRLPFALRPCWCGLSSTKVDFQTLADTHATSLRATCNKKSLAVLAVLQRPHLQEALAGLPRSLVDSRFSKISADS